MSIEAFDRQIPVSPPIVKRKIKPIDHRVDGVHFTFDP